MEKKGNSWKIIWNRRVFGQRNGSLSFLDRNFGWEIFVGSNLKKKDDGNFRQGLKY